MHAGELRDVFQPHRNGLLVEFNRHNLQGSLAAQFELPVFAQHVAVGLFALGERQPYAGAASLQQQVVIARWQTIHPQQPVGRRNRFEAVGHERIAPQLQKRDLGA